MKLTITGVTATSGLPENGLPLHAQLQFEVAAAKQRPGAAAEPTWVKCQGGTVTADNGTVSIVRTSVSSGRMSFELEPASEVKIDGPGVDVRVAVGSKAALTVED